MPNEMSLDEVVKYAKGRRPHDHETIRKMAAALPIARYVESKGSSYVKGVSAFDEEGTELLYIAAGRAYLNPSTIEPLRAAGIKVSQGKHPEEFVVLFSNSSDSSRGASKSEDPLRPPCPTCWMELPATGICETCA